MTENWLSTDTARMPVLMLQRKAVYMVGKPRLGHCGPQPETTTADLTVPNGCSFNTIRCLHHIRRLETQAQQVLLNTHLCRTHPVP
jgi:hypothetical protein